jgi:hypothetical protein
MVSITVEVLYPGEFSTGCNPLPALGNADNPSGGFEREFMMPGSRVVHVIGVRGRNVTGKLPACRVHFPEASGNMFSALLARENASHSWIVHSSSFIYGLALLVQVNLCSPL